MKLPPYTVSSKTESTAITAFMFPLPMSRYGSALVLIFLYVFSATAPQWARASSFTRFLDYKQRRTTVGWTPLNKWSARRRVSILRKLNLKLRNEFPQNFRNVPLWSKSTVNAAAECDPSERQESSIREAARRTLVTVSDKFQLVRCSQSVVSHGWEF